MIFKNNVEKIPNEIWKIEFLDKNHNWKQIRRDAELLLNSMGIISRIYNDEFLTIYKKIKKS